MSGTTTKHSTMLTTNANGELMNENSERKRAAAAEIETTTFIRQSFALKKRYRREKRHCNDAVDLPSRVSLLSSPRVIQVDKNCRFI